ncbi:MAG TPA: COX15/CtaA family protein [Cytophagaceae bacterium]|jgi:cytochrome c oxidase assembly protein subunit 15|nr:COX15/CtaA family protein [Cytophagaceae bacterium]
MQRQHLGFKRFVVLTVVSVYLLILAGGIVRTTGSGMGCPDWPKCFGRWVPPTEVSQLPADYKTKYVVHGYQTEFNAVKTWIEYINRLLGALIGIFIIVAFVLSLQYKTDKTIRILCGLALLMVILEGIVGKYVVSTNLKPLLISFHLWGSIFIIVLLIYVMCRVWRENLQVENIIHLDQLKTINVLLIAATIIQTIIGTQVRQQIDDLSMSLGFERRLEWIERLDYYFHLHRTFSIVVFLIHVYFIYKLYKSNSGSVIKWSCYGLALLVAIEMIGGITMGNFGIPAFVQPIHMLGATMLLGLQFFVLFVFRLNATNSAIQLRQ